MKKHICAAILLLSSSAWATPNVNFLSCYYFHTKDGWQFYGAKSNADSYDLAKDDSRNLNGVWTSHKPKGPEYAVCNMATGTDNDNSVVITSYKFEAKEFKPFSGIACTDFEGIDLRLISKDEISQTRGEFSEMLTDWLPPEPDMLSIRSYFPKIEEIDQLEAIGNAKCMELLPAN